MSSGASLDESEHATVTRPPPLSAPLRWPAWRRESGGGPGDGGVFGLVETRSELMTETLENFTLERKTVLAVGPPRLDRPLVTRLMREATVPVVIDADGLTPSPVRIFAGAASRPS